MVGRRSRRASASANGATWRRRAEGPYAHARLGRAAGWAVALVATLALLIPQDAEAQLFGRVRTQGELGVSMLGTWKSNGGPARQDIQLRQWLKLPFRGAILDPRIFRYDLTLNPSFGQSYSEGVPEALRTKQLGWDLSMRILSTQPVSLSVSWNRANGDTEGGLGSSGDFGVSTFSTIANLRIPYLPLRFGYFTRSSDNLWITSPGATPVAWSDFTRTWRLSAQNSKLDLVLERMDFDDRLLNRDFVLDRGNLRHRFRWGKGSRLESIVDLSERRGTSPYSRTSWQELLHLQHTRTTASDFFFRKNSSTTPGGSTGETSYGFRMTSRATRWLTLGMQGTGRDSRFNGTHEQVRSLTPQIGAMFWLPYGVRLTLGGFFGYEHRSLESDGEISVPVINERQEVDETRTFQLRQSGVDVTTVVIRNEDETLQYAEGLDYRLVEVGGVVEVIVPLTSRIQVGETVLVSYRFTPEESPEGTLLTGRFNGALNIWRLSLRHMQGIRRSSENGDNGAAQLFLGTLDESYTALAANVPTPIGLWELELSRRSREASAVDFMAYEAETSLFLPTGTRLKLQLGAAGRETRDKGGELSARSVFVSYNWAFMRRARLHGRLQAWDLDLTTGAPDRSIGGDVNLSFEIGQIHTWIRYQFNLRTEPSRFRVDGLSIRLVRRF